jgi:hypothetical protein
MNTKNIVIGGIVAAIVYFLLGYLVYGNLMMDFFRNHPGNISKQALSEVERGKNMLFWAIGVSNLGAGILLAFVFDRSGIKNFSAGLVTGAIVGFLASVSFDFMMYSTSNLMDKNAVVGDILAWTLISAIAGALCGMVMGKVSK